MRYMYSIMDTVKLDRDITMQDLIRGYVRVRPYDEAVMDSDEGSDWWPVHAVDGWSWEPVEVRSLSEAFDRILESQAYSNYCKEHDI